MATLRQHAVGKLQNMNDQFLVTAIACIYLSNKCGAQRTQWELVVKKAIAWMKKEGQKIAGLEEVDWREEMVKFGIACGL